MAKAIESDSAYEGDLGDFFEDGGGGLPAVSWKKSPVGTSLKFTVVEVDGKTVRTTQQTKPGPDGEQKYLFWPQRGNEEPRPKLQGELNVMIEFTDYSFMSAQARERLMEDEEPDNGGRRLFIKSFMSKPFKKARAQAGRRGAPLVGDYGTVTLVKQVPNEYSGESNEWAVEYHVGTPETIAAAEAWIAANYPVLDDDEDDTPEDGEAPF